MPSDSARFCFAPFTSHADAYGRMDQPIRDALAVKGLVLEQRSCANGNITIHYVEAGHGPLVVLLHGFPEFWYGFRHQIAPLACAGFRVVVPDLRGYDLSSKPREVRAYAPARLADDVAAVIRACGAERASVVGHDWGGAIAWVFAMHYPKLLDKLVILNCPHPARFARGLLNPRQLLRSWYMFFFQLPWLPEWVASRSSYAPLLSAFQNGGGLFDGIDRADLDRYRQAYAQPGALTAMINYYRAMVRPSGQVALRTIDADVLVLWGEADRHLGRELAEPPARWVPRARVQRLRDVGHFIQHERAAQVNAELIAFFSAERPPMATRADASAGSAFSNGV